MRFTSQTSKFMRSLQGRKVPWHLFFWSPLFLAANAYASSLKCNKAQTECELVSTALTVGDRIAIINEDDETIAIGQVDRLEGNQRFVRIRKKMAKITSRSRFEIIKPGTEKQVLENAYRSPVKRAAGGSLGMTSLSTGGGAPGFELAAFGSRRVTAKGQLALRGSYTSVSADVTGSDGMGSTRTKSCSYNILGAMAGFAHPIVGLHKISLAGEIDGGLGYVMASCSAPEGATNTPDEIPSENWDDELSSGVGLATRATIVAAYEMKDWKLTGGYAFGSIKNKTSHTMHLGFLFEWR